MVLLCNQIVDEERFLFIQVLWDRGPGPEPACLGPASSVWILNFMKKRCHHMSSDAYEGLFIKAEDSEKRKGLV